MKITGGPVLRARIDAVLGVGPDLRSAWAKEAASRIKRDAPTSSGRGARSVRTGLKQGRAVVRGAYWLIFVDRGTKAHDIEPKSISGSGRGGPGKAKVLRFESNGRTIFARKVHRRKMQRRPFITAGAQSALRDVGGDAIVQAWNRKRGRGGFRRTAV